MDNLHLLLVALGREHVLRIRGRKVGGAVSLPCKKILLHAGPKATQPQTRTCTHQTRTRPLHRAKLPGPGAEPCWWWHHPVCTHSSTPMLAVEGQKGLGMELCPLLRGRGITGPQYFLLLTLRYSWGGTVSRAASLAASAQVGEQMVLISGTPRAPVV